MIEEQKQTIISSIATALDLIDWMAYELSLDEDDGGKVKDAEKDLRLAIEMLEVK